MTGYNIIRIDYTQINNIQHHIINTLTNSQKLYVSSLDLYSWLLNSIILLELLQKECPRLCTN